MYNYKYQQLLKFLLFVFEFFLLILHIVINKSFGNRNNFQYILYIFHKNIAFFVLNLLIIFDMPMNQKLTKLIKNKIYLKLYCYTYLIFNWQS